MMVSDLGTTIFNLNIFVIHGIRTLDQNDLRVEKSTRLRLFDNRGREVLFKRCELRVITSNVNFFLIFVHFS